MALAVLFSRVDVFDVKINSAPADQVGTGAGRAPNSSGFPWDRKDCPGILSEMQWHATP